MQISMLILEDPRSGVAYNGLEGGIADEFQRALVWAGLEDTAGIVLSKSEDAAQLNARLRQSLNGSTQAIF